MNRAIPAAFLMLIGLFVCAPPSGAQQEQGESSRKIVTRVMPHYPEMARTMGLKGNVRAEAVVKPNGQVKSVDVKGGHPVLVRAAQDAIYRWKWEPGTHETREPIEVRFDPQQ
jgi:TonB family protein